MPAYGRGMENHHHQHDPAAESDWAAMVELLDLDADVLRSYLSEVTAWVYERAAELPLRRILDLGSGTGTGALALVQCFAEADVIALDKSAQLLARCRAKARELGVEDRIRTVQADLDAAWPVIDPVDLVLGVQFPPPHGRSRSRPHRGLHRDPPRRAAGCGRDGLLPALPARRPALGRPGLEARCHAALAEEMADQVPHLGSDWGSRLRKTGFAIEAERTFVIDLKPPLPVSTGRYAQLSLQRIRSSLEGRMSGDDLAALDTLIDSDGPDSVLRRDDLAVRTKRTVWMAKRP